MITPTNNTKSLALLHQVEEIYQKVYTSDPLLETVLYGGINCTIFLYIGDQTEVAKIPEVTPILAVQ